MNLTSILYSCGDIEPERLWGLDLDILGSRDVIGHDIIGFKIGPMWFATSCLLKVETIPLSHMVAEILCLRTVANYIPIENAVDLNFGFQGE